MSMRPDTDGPRTRNVFVLHAHAQILVHDMDICRFYVNDIEVILLIHHDNHSIDLFRLTRRNDVPDSCESFVFFYFYTSLT